MSCDHYRRFGREEISPEAFADHARECADCRETLVMDEKIAAAAREIPAPTAAPGLWSRIEAGLDPPVPRRRPGRIGGWVGWLNPRTMPVWGLAASVAVLIGVTALVTTRVRDAPVPATTNVLSEDALARVEALESQYEAAIAELETGATAAMAEVDLELGLRYRDRLETIDAQIRRCQTLLAGDRANAHVRRYLLAAYQDKKETLTALLALSEKRS